MLSRLRKYYTFFNDNPVEEKSSSFSGWNIFKNISSLSLPMALSYTFSISVFLMVIFLNRLNENDNENSATTLISTFINTFAIVGFSPLFAMSVIASKKVGDLQEAELRDDDEWALQERRNDIVDINLNGLMLALALSIPVMVTMVFSKNILTDIFRQNDDVSDIAQHFLRIYSFAIPALMTRVSTEQMMFSFGRAMPAMILGLSTLTIGTGTAVLLGFGGFGLKKMGPEGIAIGFVLEAYLTSLAYGFYLAKHCDFAKFDFFNLMKNVNNRFVKFKELLGLGGNIAFSVASEMTMALSLGTLAGKVGVQEQSSMAFINQFVLFNFLLISSFGQCCSQEINRLIGARKYIEASRVGKYGLQSSLLYTTPAPLLFAIAPELLLSGSPSQSHLSPILKYLTPIISVGVISDSIRYNILQQLRVLGDLKGSTIISIFSLSSGIVLSAYLGFNTPMGIYGVAAGNTCGIFLATSALYYRWQSRIKSDAIYEMNEYKNDERQPLSLARSLSGLFGRKRHLKNEESDHLLLESDIELAIDRGQRSDDQPRI